MRNALLRLVVGGLACALAAGVLAESARADAISGGDLYGVFVSGGEFGGDETYTIVRFMSFGPSEDYTYLLPPDGFAAYGVGFDPTNPDTPVTQGSQYFLLGALYADPAAEGSTDHLLISADWQDGSAPGSALEAALIDLVKSLTANAPVFTESADDFWARVEYSGLRDAFLGLNDGQDDATVRLLEEGSYNFASGSEDLFGHSTPAFTGSLTGSITTPVFSDGGGTSYTVPEPASLALLAGGLLAGYGVRRRRRRAA